jgi:hypothetical protein
MHFITQLSNMSQTFEFTQNITIESYQLPEDLAFKASPTFLCSYFRTKNQPLVSYWGL